MTLRFSETGPTFPAELVDDLLAGEVVFLCGTGISAPQLPDFRKLVDEVYARLGVEMDGSERRSYDAERFEETLGALSRRLADPEAMVRASSEILASPPNPALDQHRIILRLSRDLNNRVIVVTTNFDTLLELAWDQPADLTRLQSFAGQSLPAPGAADFSGIIHIHGRLQDPKLDLGATPLVLTSADYGDAYMRSSWASRFLFDLARCKTIVLVGYSANDAPVRYFLNVLEADRARFTDLHPVYAFDSYQEEPDEAETAWGTLAVTPLPYCKLNPVSGVSDHSPLWTDLGELADVVERPKRSREERARRLFANDPRSLTDGQLDELTWLLSDRGDLWPVAIDAIRDPRFFRILHENKLWLPKDAAWIIPAWIARDPEDPERFATAVEWRTIIGNGFQLQLDQRIRQAAPKSGFWLKAWRIFLSADPVELGAQGDPDLTAYALKQKLESGFVLDTELRQAIGYLTPSLVPRRPYSWPSGDEIAETEGEGAGEPKLSDLVAFDLNVADEFSAKELIAALNALKGHEIRTLEIGSDALHASLMQGCDIGMIADGYDTSDYMVPSVEEHGQNEHHNGVLFLVRAVVNAFEQSVNVDREGARRLAARWRFWPGRLGNRLLLHVMRNKDAFTSDEALQFVAELEGEDFWLIRREMALALRDRAADASKAVCAAVEERIRTTGDAHYKRYSIEEGQVDWRDHARDSEVWLRLQMLDAAGVLGPEGKKELKAIQGRRDYLDREVEDRDFFGSYSFGVRSVVGDSEPIIEADPDDRLKVAIELCSSPRVEHQMGWRSYCRSDPNGAFQTLTAADLTEPNIALWDDFLSTLAFRSDAEDVDLRDRLAIESFRHLQALNDEALQAVASSLIDLLVTGPRREIDSLEIWCDRLLAATRQIGTEADYDLNLYETALNRPAGRLARVLLFEIDHTRKSEGGDEARQKARLAEMANDQGSTGLFARAIFVQNLAFVQLAIPEIVEPHLLPELTADTDEGAALRGVLVRYGNITAEVTKIAGDAIIRGVKETSADLSAEPGIASGILRPALALVQGDHPDSWGISEADVTRTLREAPRAVRTGTLDVLVRWMHNDPAGAEEAWEKMASPFFERVWPKERKFVDEASNRYLIELVIGAGKHLPDALAQLRPFITPYKRERASVHHIIRSDAPEQFPVEVLDLLWLVFGRSGATSHDMGKVLDRLISADPTVEVDRRLQALEQRATRYS